MKPSDNFFTLQPRKDKKGHFFIDRFVGVDYKPIKVNNKLVLIFDFFRLE